MRDKSGGSKEVYAELMGLSALTLIGIGLQSYSGE